FRGFAEKRAYDYTRSGNPTRDLLGEALAELEQGAGAVVTASGMAAITVVGYLLPCGGRIVAPHDCYGGTYRLFDAWRRRGEREVEFVDFADEAALSAALSKPTALLWIETPSNPLLRITDIAAVARAGKACGALIAVDNTFLSPAWQQPLALGADLVVHSTTKYLNGHSDVVGGAVVARERSLHESLGGVESLVSHPATMTHAAMDPEAREKAGLTDGLIRLSVGIEALEDLREDLTRALARAARVLPPRELSRAAAGG